MKHQALIALSLVLAPLNAGMAQAEVPNASLSIESAQPTFPRDADKIHVVLTIKNLSAEPVNPHEIFNRSEITIKDRTFPIYSTWRRASERLIQQGETFTQKLDLKFYDPFQEIGEYSVRWSYKDLVSPPTVIRLIEKEGATAPVTARATSAPATTREIDKVYYESGELFSETDLFSDVNNGFYKTYHRNGQLRSEVRYKNGWQIYDKAFDKNGMAIVRNGEVRNYYGGGNVLSDIVRYKNDKKHGTGTYYYYDGRTVVDIWHYFDGMQAGIHTRNDQQGRLRYREDWGYPTYYVQHLRKMIAVLILSVIILLAVLAGLLLRSRDRRSPRQENL